MIYVNIFHKIAHETSWNPSNDPFRMFNVENKKKLFANNTSTTYWCEIYSPSKKNFILHVCFYVHNWTIVKRKLTNCLDKNIHYNFNKDNALDWNAYIQSNFVFDLSRIRTIQNVYYSCNFSRYFMKKRKKKKNENTILNRISKHNFKQEQWKHTNSSKV